MQFEHLEIDGAEGPITTVRLNRPAAHNAMDARLITSLHGCADWIAKQDGIRAVILTGAGKSFCAGGDLNWMRAQFDADRAGRMAEARKLADMLAAWNNLPKPVIGAAQGNAFGGGVGLLTVCDHALGVSGMKLGLTETRLGLIPATIGPYVLARMGEGPARQVFMSARLFGAEEAARLGLLSEVCAAEDLLATADARARDYLQTAPGAVAAAKSLARRLGAHITGEAIEISINALADQWESPEAQAGITAFFEKRAAPWVQVPNKN